MDSTASTANALVPDQPAWFVHRGGIVPGTTAHWMSEVLALLGVDPEPWAQTCAVRLTRVRANTLFYREGEATQALYVVRHGSFKCLRFAEDGYEHVLGFVSTGDVIGFEGLANQRQPLGVMALEDSSVLALPLLDLYGWRRQSPALDRALQRAVSAELTRARETAAMMAAVASEVRLARFLVWMSCRMAARGESSRRFLLRMSRRDIASLLAVAHETVSRGFGLLADWGYVKVDNRDVEILDMAGLVACTRSTRRDSEDPHHRSVAPAVRAARPAPAPTGALS